jgi:DNA polymerase III subunit alpha
MSVALDDTDKLKTYYDDARAMGIDFEPPDVNRGSYRFEPVDDKRVRYGLGAIKGTGQGAIEAIAEARAAGGPFGSLFDFCARVDRARINKRAVEALVKAGAFDRLEANRASLVASVPLAFDYADTQLAHADQCGLFDDAFDSHAASTKEPALVAAEPWGVKERLSLEKSAVGFFLSGHLFDQSADEVRLFAKRCIADLLDSREPQLLAGIVCDMRVVSGQRGRTALFKLDDKSEAIEAMANEELLQAHRDLLKDDELVVVQAKVQPDRFSGGLRLIVQQVWDLAGARCRFGKYLQVEVNGSVPPVSEVLRDFPSRRVATDHGDLPQGLTVRLRLHREQASADLDLGEAARFYPTDAALARWREGASEGRAEIVYE